MAKNKTVFTENSVTDFIQNIDNDQKQKDSFQLIEIMEMVSGEKAKMWGPSIVGFGSYYYKYESGHEGTAPIIGFSPRKAAFSLYVFSGNTEHSAIVERLGKFTMGKACIYVKKVDDIDLEVLKELMQATIQFLSDKYERLT